MGTTSQGHYAIRTQLGKVIRADYREQHPFDNPPRAYWIIWISANNSFTAGSYYRLYADGRFEHWHLYEDGTEERLDAANR